MVSCMLCSCNRLAIVSCCEQIVCTTLIKKTLVGRPIIANDTHRILLCQQCMEHHIALVCTLLVVRLSWTTVLGATICLVLGNKRRTIDTKLRGKLIDIEHQDGVVMDMRQDIPAPLEKLRASLRCISVVSRMKRLRHVPKSLVLGDTIW